jgi:hypothetical protein
MLAAIDFDDETPLEADEIKNEVLKGHLATELEVCEAVIAEQLPHARFGIGWLPTHPFREVADALGGRSMVRCLRHEPLPSAANSAPPLPLWERSRSRSERG